MSYAGISALPVWAVNQSFTAGAVRPKSEVETL
jgi:hypothetical protein